eukprot:7387087-Prymnesium_polylepis.1
MAAKAKKVSDKKPLSFDEMLSNSVKQREAELGMTMTEEEIEALSEKLRKGRRCPFAVELRTAPERGAANVVCAVDALLRPGVSPVYDRPRDSIAPPVRPCVRRE